MKALSQNEERASVQERTLGARAMLAGFSRHCCSTDLGEVQISVYGTADPRLTNKVDLGQILRDISLMIGCLIENGMAEILMNNQNIFRHAEDMIHRESNKICGRAKVVVRLKTSVKAA